MREDRKEELANLQLLRELTQTHFWDALVRRLNDFYALSDAQVHAPVCGSNRDQQIGKCAGYKDVINIKKNIQDEIKAAKEE